MRVISGKYRGRKLLSPEGRDVRPTSDKVKESMFDVLQFRMAGARVLDLFAGSGSLGIEAISRGASAVFCDANRKSVALLRDNLAALGERCEIFAGDYRDALRRVNGRFDAIFVDPPYRESYLAQICAIVCERDLLADDGVIVYEYDADSEWALPDGFYVRKRCRYGKTGVAYLERARRVCAVTGSFDPITVGHLSVIRHAAEQFERVYVVVANNDDKPQRVDLDTRARIVRTAVRDLDNVGVETCEGMVWEYCRDRRIDTIVRGYRNARDYAYEQEMAQFNRRHGDIETLLLQQSDEGLSDVSSTAVRAALQAGEPIRKLVPKGTEKMIYQAYGGQV